MSSKNYAELEQHIIAVMNNNKRFTYDGKEYEVLVAGKPRPLGGGECKTDVYIKLQGSFWRKHEIKISVKTEGEQEFQENKITPERAESILGPNWEKIIFRTTKKIRKRFKNRYLLFPDSYGSIKADSMTLGWKLEITTKERDLSAKIDLSDREIRNYIYKGVNQSIEKRDALVNGQLVKNSGVAEYLLATTIDRIKTPQDVLSQKVQIDKMNIGDTYLVFTANNYRINENTADGPRSLAVRVEWEVTRKGKLRATLCFDNPLRYTGEGGMLPKAKKALEELGARRVRDLVPFLEDPGIYKRFTGE